MRVVPDLNLCLGKLAAALLGATLAQWPGFALGLLLGHVFDRRRQLEPFGPRAWRGCRLPAEDRYILAATFALLGRVARLGPSVAAPRVVEQLLDELELDAAQRERARAIFRQGQTDGLPVRGLLGWLRHGGPSSQERRQWLLRWLWRMGRAGGAPAPAQRRLLDQIARRLEPEAIAWRPASAESEPGLAGDARAAIGHRLAEAFDRLGVGATAPATEIKRAYRRAVARHHPDRLLARGASAPELSEATRLTWEIRSAYEEIRGSRGF